MDTHTHKIIKKWTLPMMLTLWMWMTMMHCNYVVEKKLKLKRRHHIKMMFFLLMWLVLELLLLLQLLLMLLLLFYRCSCNHPALNSKRPLAKHLMMVRKRGPWATYNHTNTHSYIRSVTRVCT